jgi:hypothetical protein
MDRPRSSPLDLQPDLLVHRATLSGQLSAWLAGKESQKREIPCRHGQVWILISVHPPLPAVGGSGRSVGCRPLHRRNFGMEDFRDV